MERVHVEVGWATLFRVCTFGLILVALYLARNVVGVLLVGIVVALGLEPIVSYFESYKIPRFLATTIVFLSALFVLATTVYFFIPVVSSQAGGFFSLVNNLFSSVEQLHLPGEISKYLNITSAGDALGAFAVGTGSVASAITALFTKMLLTVATVLISFYLTLDRDGTERLLRVLLPDVYEPAVLKVFNRFRLKIRKWFMAQLVLSVIMGLIVGLVLWFLGVDYPLVLGVLAGIFELVPMIGPVATGAIAVAVALSNSFSLGLYVLAFFVLIHQLENHVLIPVVMGKSLRVHPVVVVAGILGGGMVAGFFGIILAVPVAVLMQEIFEYLAEKKSRRQSLGV